MPSTDQVREALTTIVDPDFGKNIVELGFVRTIEIEGPHVLVEIHVTTPACPVKDTFKAQAEEQVGRLDGVDSVTVSITAPEAQPRQTQVKETGLTDVASIVAVSSAKGGVGKSTIAAALARELAQRGYRVGLLDTDLFGPSVPTLFNLRDHELEADERNMLLPVEIDGLKIMSFGFWLGDNPAVMRGPMVTNYVNQFLNGVAWGPLDYLFLDLPPGTGDIQLTITQALQLDGAVIITTPQALAIADVGKGIVMFDKVSVPVLGVIENMAYFVGETGQRHQVFGSGGGEQLTERFGIDVLAQLPLAPERFGITFDRRVEDPEISAAADSVIRALGKSSVDIEKPDVSFDDEAVRITWADGTASRVANRELRASCRCAHCVNELTGEQMLDTSNIPTDIKAEEVRTVGNYAISVKWSDGHATGLFPFRTIRGLAGVGSAS